MLELVPISFSFTLLTKIILILGINILLGHLWYSPYGFVKQWRQAMQWQEGDQHHSKAVVMSNLAILFNSFLLNILLIAFDIRKHQWISGILASAILTGFYAFNSWNHLFFSKKVDYPRHLIIYLLDIGFTFVLYAAVSLVLIGF